MPRTTINAQTPVGPHPSLPVAANSLDLTFTAADIANFNQTPLNAGPILLIVKNDDVGSTTFTLTSSPDSKKRTGDITTYSLSTGEIAAFKFDNTEGWIQSDNMLYFQASDADVKFAVLKL